MEDAWTTTDVINTHETRAGMEPETRSSLANIMANNIINIFRDTA